MMQRRLVPYIIAAVAVLAVLAGSYLTYQNDNGDNSFEATLVCHGAFNNIRLDVTSDDFVQHGIELGDCLLLKFPNQEFTAYFIENHVGIAALDAYITGFNNSHDLELGIYNYDISEVLVDGEYGTKFTITPTGEKASYYDKIPNYMRTPSDNVDDYSTLEAYGNYREVTQGDFKDNKLYRSASPFQHNGTRYIYVDQYLRDVGVDWVFAISIDMDDLESLRYEGSYAFELYDEGRVIAKYLNSAVLSYPEEILYVMDTIADIDGCIGLSCSKGKDRTGFYCALLEALAGASYQEIRDDYLLSMVNYYNIIPYSEEYDTVGYMLLDRTFYIIENTELLQDLTNVDWSKMDITTFDPEQIVSDFLLQIGMDPDKLSKLKESLTG